MASVRDLNLIDLNDDVLFVVIDNLNLFDKINLHIVCKRLYGLVDAHSARKIKSFYINPSLDKHFTDIVRCYGKHLNKLHLIVVNNRLDKLKDQLLCINEHCEKLSTLKIEARTLRSGIYLDGLLMSLEIFSQLKHLELTNVKFANDMDFQNFTDFEVLKLENATNFTGTQLVHMHRLRVLELKFCDQLKLQHLQEFLQRNQNLCELSLIRCQEIDRMSFEDIVEKCPSLEQLTVHFCRPSAHNPNVLSHLKKLFSLKVHNLVPDYNISSYISAIAKEKRIKRWEIDGESMSATILGPNVLDKFENCKSLTELSFINCAFITDNFLIAVGKNLSLSKFSLCNCSGFTKYGLILFSALSTNLTQLEIVDCIIPQSVVRDIEDTVAAQYRQRKLTICYDINCGFRPYGFAECMVVDSWCH